MNKENEFLERLWGFYDANYREMPWRVAEDDGSYDPYKILVSELMLQQTQVARVIPKYEAFIEQFPYCEKLAISSLSEVLELWSGLGYNRRAKYLHEAAKRLSETNSFPETIDELTQLKGIGRNTAAAVLVYSFNQPLGFVETNIRTVILHEFYDEIKTKIDDEEILKKLEDVLDRDNPRVFYWAMMDYGAHLKSQGMGQLARSKAHKKQSIFEGSQRQLRGKVLRAAQKGLKISELVPDPRLDEVLKAMTEEGLIAIKDDRLTIPT